MALMRWKAVSTRDPITGEGFVYAVTSTGIYCHPLCPAKRPRRENVRFFESWQQAEEAGFRACRRCDPKRSRVPVSHVLASVEQIVSTRLGEALTTAKFARAIGWETRPLNGLVEGAWGLSLKEFVDSNRLERFRSALRSGEKVGVAQTEAGFSSSSRSHARVEYGLAMSPSVYQKGGSDTDIRYATFETVLGQVLAAATERGICRIDVGESSEYLIERLVSEYPQALLREDYAGLELTRQVVQELLNGRPAPVPLPLELWGTAFQKRVWQALQKIQRGERATYQQLAARLGQPGASRAVASACAANRVAVLVPCHRVVRSDGSLGGFRWGLERKRALLEAEKQT